MSKISTSIEVIFRKFADGEILALFPYDTGTRLGTCLSYAHVGQHSTAHLGLIKDTVLATPDEYKALYSELSGLGYLLKVNKKMNWKKHTKAFQDKCNLYRE